jgi:RimJ/RimL family protein N-acetyltransferase
MKATRDFFNQCKKDRVRWYCILADDVIAGSVSLHQKKGKKQEHAASFGISIAREFWNKGLGDKALAFIIRKAKDLRIKRLELQVIAENKRARKLYGKHGFTFEGSRKKSFRIGRKYCDSTIMAKMLR